MVMKSEHSTCTATLGFLTNHTAPRIGDNNGRKLSQYKGVRMRSWGSWVSEIRNQAAARAYDAALLCLKGSSANLNLNFPAAIPFPLLPQNTVMSPKSIQHVAAAAANATTGLTDQNHVINRSPIISQSASDGYYNEMEEPVLTEHDFKGSLMDIEALIFQSPKCMDYMLSQCGFFCA